MRYNSLSIDKHEFENGKAGCHMDSISSIEIKSFRGIKSLRLENLAQINILTGDNNCGKTSVLEVLESFRHPDEFGEWSSILRKERYVPFRYGISYYEGFYDLFDVNSFEKKVEYIIQTGEKNTHVLLTAKESLEEMTVAEYEKLSGLYSSVEEEGLETEQLQHIPKLDLEIYINAKRRKRAKIYEGQRMPFPLRIHAEDQKNIVYVSPFQHTAGMVFLDNVLDNPELYEEMLLVLQEFDENIVSINYSNDENKQQGRGVYKILSKSHKKALPLNMYGDGMKKAVLLMSAVISAKDGVLLLDEFETAIHTSAMNKVFKWILETCKKLNVQMFLTSHSKEAIDKILKCSPDVRKDMAVYTLYREKENTSVRRLSAEKAIEVQDEMGLELR